MVVNFAETNILMIKKTLGLIFILSASCSIIQAQYYYKDIISNKQLLADMAAYKENKVRTINITSIEDNGQPSEGFFCQKKISKDYSTTQLFTRSDLSSASLLTSKFNNKGLLIETNDSSAISVTNNKYRYDDNDRIISIKSVIRSADDDFTNEIVEEHLYQYNPAGAPKKMIKVKNYSDSTDILFAIDDNNLVTIEKDTRSGSKYYYYYDSKNRITDIVQENDFKKGVTPEYIFQYNNSQGLLSQMTTVEEGGNYYFVWKYTYDNGLRIREKCFNKERRLMGSIEYEYK